MFVIYVTDPDLIKPQHQADYGFLGAAVSLSSVSSPVDAGYAVKDVGDVTSKIWDKDALDYVSAPPQTEYSAGKFLDLFTMPEKLAYWSADASIDPVRRAMADYMMTDRTIDRTSTETGILLNILVGAGVITAERKLEINT